MRSVRRDPAARALDPLAAAARYVVEALEQRMLLSFSPSGPELPVNVFTAGQQNNPAVAADGDGDFVVVWQSDAQDGDSFGIYARRYDSAGVPQQVPGAAAGVTEFRVNATGTGNQSSPAVVMDADGDFIVAWRDFQTTGSVAGIHARRYDAAGVALGPDFLVNTTTATTASQSAPAIAADARGDFVVAWQSTGQDGSGSGIYARRYDSAGFARDNEFQVNTYTTSGQNAPTAAMDALGNFAIAWHSVQDGNGLGIYAKRYSAEGVPQQAPGAAAGVSEFRVNTTTDFDQFEPSAAMDSAGDLVVSWSDGYISYDATEFNVRAQRYDSTGAAQGGELLVNTRLVSPQRSSAVAMDADGDFLVTWESYDQDGSGRGVYGQLYTASGTPQGGEFLVNIVTTGNQRMAAVAMDAAGDAVVAWASNGQDGSFYGIYAKRYLQSPDTAGPIVSGLSADGSPVYAGQKIDRVVNSLAVQFSEKLSVTGGTGGANSATNPANYRLTRNGVDISSLITAVGFGLNGSTRKYDATFTLSAPLTSASYVLTARQTLRDDPAGNALDGNLDGVPGGDADVPFVIHNVVPVGGEVQVNTFTPGAQVGAAVATDPNGNFVVAWQSVMDGSGSSISARRFNAAGLPQGNEFLVNTTTVGHQRAPSIAMDADGDFVIAWDGYGVEGDAEGIYAKRYNAAGVPQQVPFAAPGVTEFRANLNFENRQDQATVAMDADGDFLIAWRSYSYISHGEDVYARRFTAAGVGRQVPGASAGVTEFRLAVDTRGNQENPSAAMDAAGDFVITWHSDGTNGGTYGAYAIRYNAAGSPQQAAGAPAGVAQFEVAADSSFVDRAAVGMDADGDFVIAWQGFIEHDILARRYNAAGVAQGAKFTVPSPSDVFSYKETPSVAMDADGDFVIAWNDDRQEGSYGVYARRYDLNGVPQHAPNAPAGTNTDFRVNTTTVSEQRSPAVAMDADGDFVVAWQSFGQDGTTPASYGIYAQRYATNQPAAVSGRLLFYNNSAFDGNNAAANTADDNAIDATKSPLLTGGVVTAANISGYAKGINGIIIDVASLPAGAGPTAADFSFRAATSGSWGAGPVPSSVTVRRGVSTGIDRMTLIWNNAAPNAPVLNGWLEVTMKANAITGLSTADVLTFGNLAGDTNGDRAVTVGDLGILATNFNKSSGATIAQGDFNGDGAITVGDLGILSTAFGKTLSLPPAGLLADGPTKAAAVTSDLKASVAAPFVAPKAARSGLVASRRIWR